MSEHEDPMVTATLVGDQDALDRLAASIARRFGFGSARVGDASAQQTGAQSQVHWINTADGVLHPGPDTLGPDPAQTASVALDGAAGPVWLLLRSVGDVFRCSDITETATGVHLAVHLGQAPEPGPEPGREPGPGRAAVPPG